jgi:8-amino-7-oxononanoate synthase
MAMSDCPSPIDRSAESFLAHLDQVSRRRARRIVTALDATHIAIDGTPYVNFASNDYLGLTRHPRVIAAAGASLDKYGTGSGAAPLITGYTPDHRAAELHIAAWKGVDAAVLLPSGYQANLAAIQTLAALAEHEARPIRFILDKLCHASLLDAVKQTGRPPRIFPHNGLAKLERLLREAPADELQVVVTESVFSMDGDCAELAGLASLKERYPFVLVLDEAHATGVFGAAGRGLAADMNLSSVADVTVMTLSKAIGCVGGAVCGSRQFCDALINSARAYLFSTSLPPMVAAAADAAISVMESEPEHQQRVREHARMVRQALAGGKFAIPQGQSPIIPLIVGSEQMALNAAEKLKAQGLLAMPIRPPTVPPAACRLRVTLSSGHTPQEIERLIAAISDLKIDGV